MIEWLKKYWWVLVVGVGGVGLLLYLKNRQATQTTGTNQLAAVLPSLGGGGTSFQPAQPETQSVTPETPPANQPDAICFRLTPSGPCIWGAPDPNPAPNQYPDFSTPAPILGQPVTQPIQDSFLSAVATTHPVSIAVHNGYTIG